jgi:hypothetical protein
MSEKKDFDQVVETPDDTQAEYVYTDFAGNPVYFDGADYWVNLNGNIEYYG